MSMDINLNEFTKVISTSLDIVEAELFGTTTNHGKRVAVLVASMGRFLNFDNDFLIALTTCALFHDNAVAEHILSENEYEDNEIEFNMQKHCILGKHNVDSLPFKVDISGFILYHHEKADGSGPFGEKEGEYPFESELIALADMLDVHYANPNIHVVDLPVIRKDLEGKIGLEFTQKAIDALLNIFDAEMIVSLDDSTIYNTAHNLIPSWMVDIEDITVIRLAEFIASIIDYKSTFTQTHSTGVAHKVWAMSDYYEFDSHTRIKAYLAASMHDIGKLKTPSSVLEKTGKLTDSELTIIKDHALQTYEILKDLEGSDDICQWASNHHEKLDGTGYPFGKTADELDFVSRLLACIDIYQAVIEERPYHPARTHEGTMSILRNMAQRGFVDMHITEDIDIVMAKYTDVMIS